MFEIEDIYLLYSSPSNVIIILSFFSSQNEANRRHRRFVRLTYVPTRPTQTPRFVIVHYLPVEVI